MASVRIDRLSKIYRTPAGDNISALQDVTFTLEAAELLAVIGPSGSGKTTLLRVIAGLEEPASGRIEIEGLDVTRVLPKNRDVAMVFQSPALYPHLTAFENMSFGLTLRGVPRAEVRERVQNVASLLGLSPLLDRRPMDLSGGERQRVALGRAIVRRPKLFLLDEPLSSVDAPTRLQLRTEIARLQRELHTPMIYVTHDLSDALSLGHRVLVLNRGIVQLIDKPDVLRAQTSNAFVAGFIDPPATSRSFSA